MTINTNADYRNAIGIIRQTTTESAKTIQSIATAEKIVRRASKLDGRSNKRRRAAQGLWRQANKMMRQARKIAKQTKEMTRQTKKIARQTKEIAKQTKEKSRQAKKIAKQTPKDMDNFSLSYHCRSHVCLLLARLRRNGREMR